MHSYAHQASYKIHTVRKAGFPDTIGKRQFHTILEVNDVDLDIDVVRITKDMRRADAYANKVRVVLWVGVGVGVWMI